MTLPIGLLCQSPVPEGRSPAESVRDTVKLARAADAWGYDHVWVAEHHSDQALASGAPEVMVAHLLAVTQRARVGAAGVLMPYHSPFHVAEQFNLLAALAPGRVDLGLGRSGGSEAHAPQALGVRATGDRTFAALDELLSWLGHGSADRPFADTWAQPRVDRPARPVVLGTSPNSAVYAAQRGLAYAFGGFLDPRQMMPSLAAYHQHFRPSRWLDRPHVTLAWYAQAADTEAEAHALTRSSELWFVETLLRGRNPTFPSPERAAAAVYAPHEQVAVAMRRQLALVGTGEQVVEGLHRLAKQTAADAVSVVTIPHDPAARLRSYELIARAAGLVAAQD